MSKSKKRSGGVKDTEAVVVAPKEFANLTYNHGFKIVFGTEGKSERLLMTPLDSFSHTLVRYTKVLIDSDLSGRYFGKTDQFI